MAESKVAERPAPPPSVAERFADMAARPTCDLCKAADSILWKEAYDTGLACTECLLKQGAPWLFSNHSSRESHFRPYYRVSWMQIHGDPTFWAYLDADLRFWATRYDLKHECDPLCHGDPHPAHNLRG